MFHTRHFPGVVSTAPPPVADGVIGPGEDYETLEDWWTDMQAQSPITDDRLYLLTPTTHTLSRTGPSANTQRGLLMDGVTCTGSITLRGQVNHGGVFNSGPRIYNDWQGQFATTVSPETDNLIFEDLIFIVRPGGSASESRCIRYAWSADALRVRRCLFRIASDARINASCAIHLYAEGGGQAPNIPRLESCGSAGFDQWARVNNSVRGQMAAYFCTALGRNTGGIGFCSHYGSALFDFTGDSGETLVDVASTGAWGTFQNKVAANELTNTSFVGSQTDLRLKAGNTIQDLASSLHGGVNFDFLGGTRPLGAAADIGCHERG